MVVHLAVLIAATSLGFSDPPSLGVACRYVPNLITCGRIGIAVWLKNPAVSVDAELVGVDVRMHEGGFGGQGPPYWEGYVHIDRHRLGLPAQWYGSKPVKFLVLRLKIRYPNGTAHGAVRIQLRPGWVNVWT
jgi:hypothetical protein